MLPSFGLVTSIATRQANMNYEGMLCGAALQRVRMAKLQQEEEACVFWKLELHKKLCFGSRNKVMPYIGEDAVTLLINAALKTEGQVVTTDNDAPTKTLLKWLHIWLDA